MGRNGMKRETIRLTFIQLLLECAGLGMNIWMTRAAGASAVGMISLIGAFYQFAATVTGGSGYLCVSRFVSEAQGHRDGNPRQMLRYAVGCSLLLSLSGSILVYVMAEPIAAYFLHDSTMQPVICFLSLLLPVGGLSACFKGWCNAAGRAFAGAVCDAAEFIIRTAILAALLTRMEQMTTLSVSLALTISMAAGSVMGLIFYIVQYRRHQKSMKTGGSGMPFHQYLRYALPVMLGSCLTSGLSTANDALIPMTLRQSGSSQEEALAQFGIFEGIVLPVLFFPSMLLCVLSGLLIPEAAKNQAAGNRQRLQYITQQTLRLTMQYGIFIAAVLLVYGEVIGQMMQEEGLAGRMIQLLAPVVPFIYLEIVLEALIKGTGRQHFSSLNYLGEYVIRISVVLICIPLWGFYGIVISYYASNVIGNCIRFGKVIRITGIHPDWRRLLLLPMFAAAAAFVPLVTVLHIMGVDAMKPLWSVVSVLCAMPVYAGICQLFSSAAPSTVTSASSKDRTFFRSLRDTSS